MPGLAWTPVSFTCAARIIAASFNADESHAAKALACLCSVLFTT